MAGFLDILDDPEAGFDAWWGSVEPPAPKAPAPDRGVAADVAVSGARGFVGVAELLTRAAATGARGLTAAMNPPGGTGYDVAGALMEAAAPADALSGTADRVGDWRDETLPLSKQTLESDPQGVFTRRALTGGVESAVTSLGVKIPAAFAGFVLGGPVGAAAGYLSGVPAFGAAQYDTALSEYRKKGIAADEAHRAALLEGASEMAFEGFTDVLQLMTLGSGSPLTYAGKQALKKAAIKILQRPVTTAAKKGAMIAGTETVGELLNAGAQNEVQRIHGLHDNTFWTALRENLGPVMVASTIFGAMGGGVSLLQQRQVKKLLVEPEPEGLDDAGRLQYRQQREGAAKAVADALAKVAPAAAIEFRRGAQVAIETGAGLPGEIDLEGPRLRAAAAEKPPADAGSAAVVEGKESATDQERATDGHGRARTGTDLQGGGPRVAPVRSGVGEVPGVEGEGTEGTQGTQEGTAAGAGVDLRDVLLGRPTGGAIGAAPDPIQVQRELMRGQLRQTPWERARDARASQRVADAELAARLPEMAVEAGRQLAEAARWGIALPDGERARLEAIVAAGKKKGDEHGLTRTGTDLARTGTGDRPVAPTEPGDLTQILGQPGVMEAAPPAEPGPTPVDWDAVAQKAGVAEPVAEAAPVEAEPEAAAVDWEAVARRAGIAEEPAPVPEVDPMWLDMARKLGLKDEDIYPKVAPGDRKKPKVQGGGNAVAQGVAEVGATAGGVPGDGGVGAGGGGERGERSAEGGAEEGAGEGAGGGEAVAADDAAEGAAAGAVGEEGTGTDEEGGTDEERATDGQGQARTGTDVGAEGVAAGKEPWEMTRAEFVDWSSSETGLSKGARGETAGLGTHEEVWGRGHRVIIKKAIREGKPVPPSVLAEYPDLAQKPPPPAGDETDFVTEEQPTADILTKAGKPFANVGAARFVMQARKLGESHLIVRVAGGFVLRAKKEAGGTDTDGQGQTRPGTDGQGADEAKDLSRNTGGGAHRIRRGTVLPEAGEKESGERGTRSAEADYEAMTLEELRAEHTRLTNEASRADMLWRQWSTANSREAPGRTKEEKRTNFNVELVRRKKAKEDLEKEAARVNAIWWRRKKAEEAAAPAETGEKQSIKDELEGMSDEGLDALLDEVGGEEERATDEERGTDEHGQARTGTDEERTTPGATAGPRVKRGGKKTREPAKAAGLDEVMGAVAAEVGAGLEESVKAVFELFGGANRLSMGLSFDEDTYAKAKPHFQAAYEHYLQAGKTLREFVKSWVDKFGAAIKPYLKRFMQETRDAAKAEKDAKKAEKDARGNFQNVGYVYDPEDLARKVEGKPAKTAVTIILEQMVPSQIWRVELPEGASFGTKRLMTATAKFFKPFKDFVNDELGLYRYTNRRVKRVEDRINAWLAAGHTIDELKNKADEYGQHMAPIVNAFAGKTTIMDAIGELHEMFVAELRNENGSFPEFGYEVSQRLNGSGWASPYRSTSYTRPLYDFLTDEWQHLLANENEVLLSEIDLFNRTRNKEVIRTGLPDYRENGALTKTEDFQEPFGFKGVGYGTAGWINQEERNRVVPAAFDAFKDLAATLGAPDAAMSIGGNLAVQFANLGHKSKGAAAAYFPDVRTINFTRDSGDGCMAHEWGHALHFISGDEATDVNAEIEKIIDSLYYTYDFTAGARLVDDLLAKDSPFAKRLLETKKQQRLKFIKDAVREKFEAAVRQRSNYLKVSERMHSDYTVRRTEMWARVFEAFIYDTLAGRNNYLVNDFVEAGRVGGASTVGRLLVYPAGAEREAFNEAIQTFFAGVAWDETGKPELKDDYQRIENRNEERMVEELAKLLDQVEERYRAIWASEPSADGNFWYRYDVTAFGPMMQPDGYVGYDKGYKENEQEGAGAVGYLTQLHPDHILDYRLTNIQYTGNPVYISPEGGDGRDVLQGEGEKPLDETPAGDDEGAEAGGDVRRGDRDGGRDGDEGTYRPGTERDAAPGGQGDGDDGVHSAAPRANYRITDDGLTDPAPIPDRFNRNLAAVRLLKQLEEADQWATGAQQTALAGYSGWGGMSEAFSSYPATAWESRAQLIQNELSNEEQREAAASSVTAYYTPVPVARFMWKLAQRLGFRGGQVLDPAFGANGVFTGTIPDDIAAQTSVAGVEMDGISARIAAKLYELARVENAKFEDAKVPRNRYDLTITNVPFANYAPADAKHNKSGFKIHNYFINKMLDATSPGALCAVITSARTLDNEGKHLAEFAGKADLVGAIRLPSDIYSATGVVTDIVVFRKKIEGSAFAGVPVADWTVQAKDESTGLTINRYFIVHPEMVAGKLEKVTGRYGDDSLRVVADGDLSRKLAELAAAFPEDIVERTAVKTQLSLDDLVAAPGTVKEGGLYRNAGGQVAQRVDGKEVVFATGKPAEKRAAAVADGFVDLLDGVRRVLRAQRQNLDESQVKAEQAQLKKDYDAFVKAYGPINDEKNLKVFKDATDSPWVTFLEDYDPDEKKVLRLADLFTKKIVGTETRPTYVATDLDALNQSLDEFGYANLEYMAALRNSSPEKVLAGVQDKVVENPETGFLETLDEYLSGNVRRKLAVAKEMAASVPEYERNVKLLEAAQPDDIPPHRITARLGASWVSPEQLAQFFSEKMQMGNDLTPVFNFNPATGKWTLTYRGREQRSRGRWGEVEAETRRAIERYKKSVQARNVWGTPQMDFFALVERALEGRRPVVTYVVDKKTYTDPVATAAAEAKLDEIQREFGRWLFADNARADEAAGRFNRIVNTSVKPQFDGSHLTFPGKSQAALTPKEAEQVGVAGGALVFYPHQVNAAWRYLRTGNVYLAHEVGAGKTMTMALIGMEARRIKGKKKVVYVTLNDSTMGQAVEEIKRLYPLANIMPVRVSTEQQRKRHALQKLAVNDFDIAIMRQQDLDRIGLSPEAERVFIDQDLEDLREVLEEARAAGARILERDIQERIAALESKLQTMAVHAEAIERQEVYFDDLGIDLLILDEAHSYKNVPYATSLDRITGLNPAGSPTAHAFFRKTQYLNAQFPKHDAIVLASGTPLTNSIAELYNLQRMLQPQEVKRQGVWHFDRWIANFGDIGSQTEWDGARGDYKTVTVNRRIVNAGRLMATAFQNIDSVRAEDTPIQRPKIYGGKPTAVSIKPNTYVEDYKRVVLERVHRLEMDPKRAEHEGIPDNMLRIISNMSAVAIDQRLLVRKGPDGTVQPGPYSDTELQEDSKIYQAARIIQRRWEEEADKKGVQLVFADIGVPGRFAKGFKEKSPEDLAKMTEAQRAKYESRKYEHDNAAAGSFNTYDGLKAELIKLGIPAEQIAFIHDADHSNKDKKAANLRRLFKRVNSGQVRVLIGSTTKAGTGVNVQERVSDVHHLDVWWNYSAWEQRNGRAIRAGNIYTEGDGVRIWNYVAETTVDATRWSKIFAKGKQLNAALSGDVNIDVIEDISDETLSAKEMEAIASGNPLLARQAELMQKAQRLGLERSGHLNMVREARYELAHIPDKIATRQHRIETRRKSRDIMGKVTAVRFIGSDETLVLEKHGKEIAAALERAVKASVPNPKSKEKSPWDDKDHTETLLVYGTHSEETVEIEQEGGKKTKKKRYVFHPLPAKADLIRSELGDIRSVVMHDGYFSDEARAAAIGAKGTVKEMFGNISRQVTNHLRWLERSEAEAEAEIAEMEKRVPELQKVVDTPWPKEQELKTAEDALAEVERQMAGARQDAGNPADGLPVAQYRGTVPFMDDVADADGWKTAGGVIYPRQNDYVAFAKTPVEMKRFFRTARKQFSPGVDRFDPEFLEVFRSPGARSLPEAEPSHFSVEDGNTRFWIKIDGDYYRSASAAAWTLAQRVVGDAEGTWRFRRRGYDRYLVHVLDDGEVDAAVQVIEESRDRVPKGVLGGLAGEDGHGRARTGTDEDTDEATGDFRRAGRARQAERAATVEDVRAVFAGQDVGLNADGSVWVKLVGGARLTIRKVRRVDDGTARVDLALEEGAGRARTGTDGHGQARTGGEDEALGRYFEREIQLQQDEAGIVTLWHESEHFLERAGLLRGPEIAALRRHIQALAAKGKWKPFDKADVGGMEDRAEWVARNINARENMHGVLRKMLDRVADFLARLWNLAVRALGADGLTSARGVVGEIRSGRVFERRALEKDRRDARDEGAGRPDFMFAGERGKDFKAVDVNSEGFRRWFDGGAVVDDDGKPLRVYHATKEEFDAFEKSIDGGYHFGSAAQADMRVAGSGKRIVPVYLNARKLRRSKDHGGSWKQKIHSAIADGYDGIVYLNRYEGIKSPERASDARQKGIDLERISDAEFKKLFPEAQDSYIVFDSTKIKSAISNTGGFSDTNPNILYRRVRQAADEIEADTLSFFEKIKIGLRPARLTEEAPADLNYVRDLLLRTPAFFAGKLAGTRLIYRAGQKKRDEAEEYAYEMENHGDVNAVKLWDALSEADAKRPGEYLRKSDVDGGGFKIRLDAGGKRWQVMDDAGRVIEHFESRFDPSDADADLGEIEAAERRRELEKEALRAEGFNDNQLAVIMAWRMATDKGFDLLVRDMRRAARLAEQTGAKAPLVTVTGDDGKPKRIDMQAAMALMGELRGTYFPRIRKRGQFVLKARRKREGVNPSPTGTGEEELRREHFGTGAAMNIRAEELRRAGWTVTTEAATEVGEDVFALEGSLVKTQQLVNAALAKLDRKLKDSGALDDEATAEMADSVQEIFAGGLAEQIAAVIRGRGARGHMIRRSAEVWKGYEEDPKTALAKYVRGLAGAEAKRRMTVRMMRALMGTSVSRADFELAVGFDGDYEAFIDEHGRARTGTDEHGRRNPAQMLEEPDAMTREVFEAVNDPVGLEENRDALADLQAMLEGTTDADERKVIGQNIAEKKRWLAQRYKKLVDSQMIDQRKSPHAFKWAKAFIEENTRNPDLADRIIGVFRGLAVGKYLAFRVFSAPVVNLTALPTSVIATMKAAGIPYADCWRHLGAAIADYLPYRRGQKLDDADRQKVFDYIRHRGWDNAQYNSEAMAALRGAVGRGWDKTIEYGMITFSESERLNRAATIAAAYAGLRALEPTAEFEDLMERALKVSDDAHGVYNKGNYPYLALGRHPAAHVARLFNVFKVFAHTYFQNMARIGFEEKDYGAMAHMVVAPAVLAGMGASALMPVAALVAKAFGADEPEEELYQKIGATFGLTAEELARSGLVGQLGFTVKGSLAVAVGDMPTNLRDLAGAPASVVMDLYKALGYASRGDWLKALEAGAPTGAGNIVKAVRERTQGVTTAGNAPVFWGKEQLRPTLGEAFWRGLGFNPTRMATIRERQYKEYKVADKYNERRADIYAKFRRYAAEGRTAAAELAEIMGEVADFNEGAERWNLAPITVKRLEAAAAAKADRREAARGKAPEALVEVSGEAQRLIEALEKAGHLDLAPPSRQVVYRHRRYEMPEAAWDIYRRRSAQIAGRKIERAMWRLATLSPERQGEEIARLVSAARRMARAAGRRVETGNLKFETGN